MLFINVKGACDNWPMKSVFGSLKTIGISWRMFKWILDYVSKRSSFELTEDCSTVLPYTSRDVLRGGLLSTTLPFIGEWLTFVSLLCFISSAFNGIMALNCPTLTSAICRTLNKLLSCFRAFLSAVSSSKRFFLAAYALLHQRHFQAKSSRSE